MTASSQDLTLSHSRIAGRSIPVNRTIDDEFGDSSTGALPVYYPEGVWVQGSDCVLCSLVDFDNTRVFNGTWHEAALLDDLSPKDANVVVHFEGTAVYVYNMILPLFPLSISFYVDEEHAGDFNYDIGDDFDILYDVAVFVNETLSDNMHTLRMVVLGDNMPSVFFDYIVYTALDRDTSQPPMTSIGSSLELPSSPITTVVTHTTSSTLSSAHSPTTSSTQLSLTTINQSFTITISTSTAIHASETRPEPSDAAVSSMSTRHSDLSALLIGGITLAVVAALFGVGGVLCWTYMRLRQRRRPRAVCQSYTGRPKADSFVIDGGSSDLHDVHRFEFAVAASRVISLGKHSVASAIAEDSDDVEFTATELDADGPRATGEE